MEIGGHDCIINGTISRAKVLEIIQRFWPDYIVENDDPECDDFFVYPNQTAMDMWNDDNTDGVDEHMIYVLPRKGTLTMVIDSDCKLMPIAEAVKQEMENAASTGTQI